MTILTASSLEPQITSHIRELDQKLPYIKDLLENIQLTDLPSGSEHSAADRELIIRDHSYAIRRYVSDAASVISSSRPSMQISSLGSVEEKSVTSSSTYKTAQNTFALSQNLLDSVPEYHPQALSHVVARMHDLKCAMRTRIELEIEIWKQRECSEDFTYPLQYMELQSEYGEKCCVPSLVSRIFGKIYVHMNIGK